MGANLAKVIDRLGELKAAIAELEIEQKALNGILKDLGDGAYEGDLFRATVSTSDRETLPIAAAKTKLVELGVDGRWFSKNTKVTTVTTVKVVARTGELLDAAE